MLIATILGWGLDAGCGEPRRWHPVVGLGQCAEAYERYFGASSSSTDAARTLRIRGGAGVAMMVLGTAICVMLAMASISWMFGPWARLVAEACVLYLCLGHRSLSTHARAVCGPLEAGDLVRARVELAKIVSRDTTQLDEEAISKGVVESVLENGSDAVIASLFWFMLAGAPGVAAHRVINTLDAMWGYRTPRYLAFGAPAARLDDWANWIPARLSAFCFALVGDTRRSLRCWATQAHRYGSPNAGPVMAAGAGALGIELGGPAIYHGQLRERPTLGCGRPAQVRDIDRALALLRRAAWLAVVVMWGLSWLIS